MTKVQGKDVILSIYDGSSFIPVGCATNVTINVDTELLPVTTNNSGVWRSFIPRFNEWTFTCEGVTILAGSGKYLPLDTLTLQVRQSGINFQITFTDSDSNTNTFEGFAYIYNTSIDSQYGDFSNFSFSAKGSGAFTLDSDPPTGISTGMTIEFNGDDVTTTFNDASLIGVTLHLAFVDHLEKQIITIGTPTGEQVKYNSGAGSVEFLTAPPTGVRIKLFYE